MGGHGEHGWQLWTVARGWCGAGAGLRGGAVAARRRRRGVRPGVARGGVRPGVAARQAAEELGLPEPEPEPLPGPDPVSGPEPEPEPEPDRLADVSGF